MENIDFLSEEAHSEIDLFIDGLFLLGGKQNAKTKPLSLPC